MKEYDKDKFVILVSAGPTARNVKESSQYYSCGVNVTPKFIEKTNFWVVNDGCYFQDLSSEKLETIENLALPEFPHTVNGVNFQPHPELNYEKATKKLPNNIKIHPFNIQSCKKFNMPYDPSIVYFDVKSSNESAVKWLMHLGFRKFISLGQDPEGEYHSSMFTRPTLGGGQKIVDKTIDNSRYRNVQTRIKLAIKEKDALMIRLVLPEGLDFDNNILTKCKALENKIGYHELDLCNSLL